MKKEKEKLHTRLVLKYFWQVIRQYKLSFFTVIILALLSAGLDIYIPLRFLKLWEVLNTNNFFLAGDARIILVGIFILGLIRWMISRSNSFVNSFFQASVLSGLRKQAFSYLMGHSHSFFANNFSGSLIQKINKYTRAFERLMDSLIDDIIPLSIRSIGSVIAIYTINPKYSYILAIFCLVFILTAFVYTRLKLKYDIIASELDSKTSGALADSIGNHSSIELFASQECWRCNK